MRAAVVAVAGLGVTARTILAVGTLAGGAFAAWKILQEVAEWKKLGPPAWWVVWRSPLAPAKPSGLMPDRPKVAARVYRWRVDIWVPVTDYLYDSAAKSMLVGGPPEMRDLYAQARWEREGKFAWKKPTVTYARDAKVG